MKKNNYIIGIVIILFDQLMKALMINIKMTIIPNFLYLKYIRNTGAAFGLGSFNVVLVVNIFIIIALILYIIKQKEKIDNYVPYILIISGGIGNLIDRIFRGYVIDFIDIDIFNFPTFNIADICISIGVIWIIVNLIKKQNNVEKKK